MRAKDAGSPVAEIELYPLERLFCDHLKSLLRRLSSSHPLCVPQGVAFDTFAVEQWHLPFMYYLYEETFLAGFMPDQAPSAFAQDEFANKDPMYELGTTGPYYQNSYLWPAAISSPARSYLETRGLYWVLACAQEQEVWMDYDTDPVDLFPCEHTVAVSDGNDRIVVDDQKLLDLKKDVGISTYNTQVLCEDLRKDYRKKTYLCPFVKTMQRHYLVVIPAALRYPSTQVACLHITCHEAKLQVNLVLEHSVGHELLMQETIQKKKTFLCTKFWVAPPANGTEEIATVKLTITGEGVNIEEKKKVLICKTRSGTIIQTDKPIYQPGQTVKFRIVTLDEEFVALNDSDPKNNQIEQWLNVVPQDGIADLSFQLSDEPLLGTYVINVTSVKAYGSFSVKEYVLPKFEVIFEAPNQIYALDTTFPLRICGRYAHGKSIQGIVHVSLCQKIAPFLPSASKPNLCHKFNNQTDEAGCFFTNVSLSSFSRDFRYYQDSIVAEASLVEDATETQVNASHKLLISRIGGMALFDDVNSYYHTGEMYRGKIKVIDYQGKALKHKEVLLVVSCGEQQFKQKYITGDSGTASFSLDTTAWNSTLASLEASVLHQDLDREPGTIDLSYQRASYFIRPFYSTSRSFLSIVRVPETIPCGKKQSVQVEFRIYEEDLEHGPRRVIFSYFVTGKGGIVHAGQKTVWVGLPKMLEGFFSIPLTFNLTSAPTPRLVVYVIFPNGKIIADSAIFSVSMCFRNKVELGFSTPETLPGSQVGLHLLAAPGSTCAVWAVDRSTLLIKPGRELSSHSIYGLFPSVYNSRYPHQVSEDDRSCGFPNSDEPDVFTAFRGETFNLKATIFNNLQQCMKATFPCFHLLGFLFVFVMFIYYNLPPLLPLQIQVTLEEFAHFQLKPCKDCVYSSCLCAGEAKTFRWSVTAEQLGEKNREVGW
ncbi:alpha-2-macroglobulin-like protein 1 [Pitangus sulphuratus]|nr:alpha-2-macroglobulin-like protein 1 [Pitangus sulphuratus]KAJ7427816.1 alpha-2-macroglobulin-like protein 1 [Pitangus sulphuratus]